MEARSRQLLFLVLILPNLGASARTKNFVVTAPTPDLASDIARAAEQMRRDLAREWLGRELPDWSQPCPVVAKVSPHLGAGGRTSFMFRDRVPFGWDMEVQGSRERVLDSVLPHEITHTIFATHYGCPLPRWADEGACTTVEHVSERRKQELWLVRFLKSERGIPFNHMFAMKEYPGDILPLYSQGYSVARYLIGQGGKRRFVDFVGDGLKTGDWNHSVQRYYGFQSLGELQTHWVDWVAQGCPDSFTVPTASAARSQALLASGRTTNSRAAAPTSPRSAQPHGRRPLIDDQLVYASRSESSAAKTSKSAARTSVGRSWYAR